MRILSTPARQAVFSESTDEVMLVFLDLELPGGTTLRVVNNWEPVERGGETYLPYRFDVAMPDERDEGLPIVQLRIDNVDRVILEELQQMNAPVPVKMNVALASSPDTTQAGQFEFRIVSVNWDEKNISSDMTFDDVLTEVYPGFRVNPSTHPAAFAG